MHLRSDARGRDQPTDRRPQHGSTGPVRGRGALQPGVAEKLNVFYGRKNAIAFQSTDNYVGDINSQRENYQLEPAAIVRDPDNLLTVDATFYDEALNFIQTENGKINRGCLTE